ncbi:CRIB domain-containing protein RIC4 [Coffea arabica]|uniref:CRIB domain-containing protein RIC4 n=1 Tax=Coffea arabica TaxID=13443 RepID=A0A6P6UA83_COFAR|nr:CRIB domain-containing protein RIC4-like [Coffea arabica]
MRDRIERLVLLPFSMGCVSESSIAVGPRFPDRPKNINANSTPTRTPEDDKEGEEESEDDEESLSDDNLKSPSRLLAAPKIQKLFKNFKNLSQLFAYKDDEIEEEGTGMEIGLPTDVKHVTHIGIDGSATSILSKGWGNPKSPGLPSANCPPSAFAFAMPAQADKAKVSGP